MVEFDEASGKIVARRREMFNDLVLEEGPAAMPASEEVAAALAKAAADRLDRAFPSNDPTVAGFRTRVQCLAGWMPELNLPALDDTALRNILPQLAIGRRSLDELRRG